MKTNNNLRFPIGKPSFLEIQKLGEVKHLNNQGKKSTEIPVVVASETGFKAI